MEYRYSYTRITLQRAESAILRRVYASRLLLGLVLLCGFIIAQLLAPVRS